jgi:hypothetical protein
MKVVFLAFNEKRFTAAIRDMGWAAENGAEVVVVTINATSWPATDRRVKMMDIGGEEARHPLPRMVHTVLFWIPRRTLRLLARVLGRLGRVRGVGRPARLLRPHVVSAMKRSDRAARVFRARAYYPLYRQLRPYILSRVARKHVIPALQLQPGDHVVVCDTAAVPLAWHIARQYPAVRVAFSLEGTPFGARPAERLPA